MAASPEGFAMHQRFAVAAVAALFLSVGTVSASANDFVLVPGRVNESSNTCGGASNASFFQASCGAPATLFNRDTSEIYMCEGTLMLSIQISNKVIVSKTPIVKCSKQPAAFPNPGKYSILESSTDTTNILPPAHKLLGSVFWVSQNDTLHVKACFFMQLADAGFANHFECVDATIN
jgi:hypothetical protein